MSDVWVAFGLTVFAGMATGIGSIIAFTAKRTNYRFLSISTGVSAGVLLYVSFVEIFYKGVDSLIAVYGESAGHWINAASFFGGMFLIGAIDNLIPSAWTSCCRPAGRAPRGHDSLLGLMDGMITMALSLPLMK